MERTTPERQREEMRGVGAGGLQGGLCLWDGGASGAFQKKWLVGWGLRAPGALDRGLVWAPAQGTEVTGPLTGAETSFTTGSP